MPSLRPIAIFDSGSGGLSLVHYLEKKLPNESILYVGDLIHFPYGEKSPEAILRYSLSIGRFLEKQGAKLLVIGCNTASALTLQKLKESLSIPVLGLIQPCAREVAKTSRGRVGVIATSAMIRTGLYEKAISAERGLDIRSKACPTLAYLIEQQLFNHPAVPFVIRSALRGFAEVDTIVLGCTHYFLIRHHVEKALGAHVAIIDPAEACSQAVVSYLEENSLLAPPSAARQETFFTSAWEENFQSLAPSYLNRPIPLPKNYQHENS